MVLNQADFLGVRLAPMGQPFQSPGIVDCRPALSDVATPLASEWLKPDKAIDRAQPLLFIIDPFRLAGVHGQRLKRNTVRIRQKDDSRGMIRSCDNQSNQRVI